MAKEAMDDLYPGMDDEAEPSKTGEHDESMPHKDKEEDGETALLPKSFFEGQEIKPGEQYYVEIVRAYEDEVLIRYPHKIKGEEEESADDKIHAMGKEMGRDNPGNYGAGGY